MNQIYCENIPSPLWNDHADYSLSGCTDLWRIPIYAHASQVANFLHFMSEEETIRVKKYRQDKDKTRFIVGKGMLRVLLSKYLDCSPNKISFTKSLNNKPIISLAKKLEFNVSYSNKWVIVAISTEPIGVDIEFIDESFDHTLILDSCFTKEEIDHIKSAPQPKEIFFRSWTRKEALLKAVSRGLDDCLKNFSCLDGLQPIPAQISLGDNWNIKSFTMDREYSVSIAGRSLNQINSFTAMEAFF